MLPPGVMRPMAFPFSKVYQRLPSGPAVMPPGKLPARGNSVMRPAVVMRPILPPSFSVNQRLPSGPAVMSKGVPLVGMGNSVTVPTAAQTGALLRPSKPTETTRAVRSAARRARHLELFMLLPLFLSFPRSSAYGETDGKMFHKILLALSHARYLQTFRLCMSIRRRVTPRRGVTPGRVAQGSCCFDLRVKLSLFSLACLQPIHTPNKYYPLAT